MVTVNVNKIYLRKLLGSAGKTVGDDELVSALAEVKAAVDAETPQEYSLEVTGDRPDLLSAEGVARALKGHLGIEKGLPQVDYKPSGIVVHAEESATRLRPYIVGAVVRNVRLAEAEVADLFQTQEKLDLTHGRRRKKVSIGLYDLAALKPPFYFRSADPANTSFHPLKSEKKMTLAQIMTEHPTGAAHSHLLEGMREFPVLVDSAGEILSLVPIINGISSSVTSKTTDLFIDHTGSDLSALNTSLNILCMDFADRGAKVETVEIHYGSKKVETPNTRPSKMELGVAAVNGMLGLSLTPAKMSECLARQRIGSASKKDDASIECLIPPYRADFLHPVDLVEEVALGYGYNSFEPTTPSVFTKGGLSDATRLQDLVEEAMVGAGYLQTASYITSNERLAARALLGDGMPRITNPVSEEYDRLRTHLLPGVLNLLSRNTHSPYPQRVFEFGEAVAPDAMSDTGYCTRLKVCAASAHAETNLSEAASVLSSLLSRLGIPHSLKPMDSRRFIPGRGANIILQRDGKDSEAGFIGELHPEVLTAFGLQMPCAVFELALD